MDAKRDNNSRAPKQLGDFGEGFVTYALHLKKFEVACVDHVGADLIAIKNEENNPYRIAVSVKTRLYKAGSIETRGSVIEYGHVEKLITFAGRFKLEPVFAHVVCIEDDKMIHLFMLRISDIKKYLPEVKHGWRLRFSEKYLEETKKFSYIDYSCWRNESFGSNL